MTVRKHVNVYSLGQRILTRSITAAQNWVWDKKEQKKGREGINLENSHQPYHWSQAGSKLRTSQTSWLKAYQKELSLQGKIGELTCDTIGKSYNTVLATFVQNYMQHWCSLCQILCVFDIDYKREILKLTFNKLSVHDEPFWREPI